jgi:hypothetical protein
MSMTDFMALGDNWSIEARKLPAAPALGFVSLVLSYMALVTHITKSMLPNSFAHLSAAACSSSGFLTSTAPMPMTFAPFRAVAMSLAMLSVFSTLRPTMQALAPRCTMALT